MAKVVRRRDVAGHAVHGHHVPAGRRDGCDRGKRAVTLFQDRPLFDMEFKIADIILTFACGFTHLARVESEIAERLTHAHAILVGTFQPFVVPAAAEREGAQQRGAESRAFLVTESQHLDGERQFLVFAGLRQVNGHGNRGHHTENAVVFAGIRHGIQVRAENQCRQSRFPSLKAAYQIARLVYVCGESGLFKPLCGQSVGFGHLRRKIVSFDAVLHAGQFGQLVAAVEDLLGGACGPLFCAHRHCSLFGFRLW